MAGIAVGAPAAPAAPAPTALATALSYINFSHGIRSAAGGTAQGSIPDYEKFCEKTGLPSDAGTSKPQYAGYLLLVLQNLFPAHGLDNEIRGFTHLLLKNDKQSMQQLKRQLDTFYQAITGLVPFPNLNPLNKFRRFVIDDHQCVHYQGGKKKKKNHFCFDWQSVHRLILAGARRAVVTTHGQTDGDFIFLVRQGGSAKVLAEETDKCEQGYLKIQMGYKSGVFAGHGYPLDKEAADREKNNAIDLDWTLVTQMQLASPNDTLRVKTTA
jgi:hypothetical protein